MKVYKLNTGDAVTGVYYNVPFSGIVTSTRFHSCRRDLMEIGVQLYSPISVYGDPRQNIIVACDAETGLEVKGWEGSYLTSVQNAPNSLTA